MSRLARRFAPGCSAVLPCGKSWTIYIVLALGPDALHFPYYRPGFLSFTAMPKSWESCGVHALLLKATDRPTTATLCAHWASDIKIAPDDGGV
ncbi:hypothetical protein EXIGLDRAFT_721475 [Exidia glandulosa HHB12029]|uniref:Uncharacterized protein n=1 Tax=Exidia glandulosa HHB12029 TaxID=1314781 RepID=A0A166A7W1_EXIGL|nr:hypothetical protein EXIGLDRAFT_721475 [Exidia glandulosa HHB12029]